MARIAGINIPPNQHAEIGLTAIYGIGRSRARDILSQVGVEYTKKIKDLTDAELERIRDAIGQYTIEGDLRREVQLSIKRLIDLGTYRGMRHRRGLPVRGVAACPFAVNVLVRMLVRVRARRRLASHLRSKH